jgi:putative DNA primase/helicase
VSAADIAVALGGARQEGRAWRCRCPLHRGRSLVLKDGERGCVLATCWGGCDRRDVLAELHRRGLLGGRADYRPATARQEGDADRDLGAERTARALDIWRKARPGAGTIVEDYLATRGIRPDTWPVAIRFHSRCPRPRDADWNSVPPLPAMVGLVEHAERGPVAVHVTYLHPDGSGKAHLPRKEQKASFGPVGGGAVRLGKPCAGEWFAIAEGIETTAAVVMACAIPGWAAISANGIRSLVLPPEATHVIICADHDASGTGERAARDAAQRWMAEGRRVRVALPPEGNTDFNDLLMGCSGPLSNEVKNDAA